MGEVNKIAFYATDGGGYINRDGSSFFPSPLYLRFLSSNADLSCDCDSFLHFKE